MGVVRQRNFGPQIYGALHSCRLEDVLLHPFVKPFAGDPLNDRQDELECGILIFICRAGLEGEAVEVGKVSERFAAERI